MLKTFLKYEFLHCCQAVVDDTVHGSILVNLLSLNLLFSVNLGFDLFC